MKRLLLIPLLLALPLAGQQRIDKLALAGWLEKQPNAYSLVLDQNLRTTDSPTFSTLTLNPTLGAEINTGFASWTAAAGWTYGGGKWTHSSGTTALTDDQSALFVVGSTYKIVIGYTWAGAGSSISVTTGGQTGAIITSAAASSITYYVKARATTRLTVTPTTGFTGSIDSVSIKALTAGTLTSEAITMNSGQLQLPSGNCGYPSIAFTAATQSGIYYDLAEYIMFSVNSTTKLGVGSGGLYNYSGTMYFGASNDLTIGRDAAASLQLGSDAASATDQTIKAHDGSGTDKAGAALTLQSGQSTGTGVPNGLKLQTCYTGTASSSTAQTQYTRQWDVGKTWSLSNNSATALFSIAVADPGWVAGWLEYSIIVTDASSPVQMQTESGIVTFSGVNKVTETWTTDIDKGTVSTALSAGTLTTTWAVDTATADTFKVTLNSNSGTITPATIIVRLVIHLNAPAVITLI
jgi:hypothetical protein